MPSSVGDLAALGKLIEEHRPKLGAMLQRRIDPALAARHLLQRVPDRRPSPMSANRS
jgi:hypothetical protein